VLPTKPDINVGHQPDINVGHQPDTNVGHQPDTNVGHQLHTSYTPYTVPTDRLPVTSSQPLSDALSERRLAANELMHRPVATGF
jgi:hypothetical protein